MADFRASCAFFLAVAASLHCVDASRAVRPRGERATSPVPSAALPEISANVPDAGDLAPAIDAAGPEPDAAIPPEAFRPADVGPMKTGAPTDGAWTAYPDPAHPGLPTIAFTTRLRSDPTRALAEVFILALQSHRVRLFAMAGVEEPKSSATNEAARSYVREGRIPAEHHGALLAAFDGGFKVQHGGLGMMVDGITLVPPKDEACTVAGYKDGALRIAPWSELASTEPQMLFFRQTPRCLYAHGTRNGVIIDEKNIRWGAAFNGDTVIRRSAIGLDAAGETLFVAVSNATTPLAMAEAMHHAGAVDVAQLDVNWSFPKLLVYRKNARGDLEASSLFPGFVFTKDEYVRRHSARDFLYVIRTDIAPAP